MLLTLETLSIMVPCCGQIPEYGLMDPAISKPGGHALGIRNILRNKRISKKRSQIERCFAVIKRAHKAGHVQVTTFARAGMKFMMSAFVYNLVQLRHLVQKKN